MGTHAIVTFKDAEGSHSVFKHYDGNPSEILNNIREAKKYAWPLPRFEADEFSAAFVVALKLETVKSVDRANYGGGYGGGVRLIRLEDVEGWSINYQYLVECIGGRLVVEYMDETEAHGSRLERVKL